MAIRMSKTRLIIMVILIIAVVALVGIALSCNSSSSSEAPDFTLPTMTGANIILSELEGTPVVLNFWTTTCGYCVKQLPYFEDVAQQSEEEIEVIAINVGQSAATVQTFFGENEPTMIIALDIIRETFADYCQNYNNSRGYVPFTVFVDSTGVVLDVRIGAFTSEEELWETLYSVFEITGP